MKALMCFIFSIIALSVHAQITGIYFEKLDKTDLSRLSCVNGKLTYTETSAGGIPLQHTIWVTKEGKEASIDCAADKYSVFGNPIELSEVITIGWKLR